MFGLFRTMLIIAGVLTLTGCKAVNTEGGSDKMPIDAYDTLAGLSYEEGKNEADYTIMIEENGDMIPYYVLTGNYNGSRSCLLLRKNLLQEDIPYCTDEYPNVYYDGCYVNHYLNSEFANRFTPEFLKLVEETDVPFTGSEGLTAKDHKIDTLKARFFILSKYEVEGTSSTIFKAEGEELDYFDDRKNLLAAKDSDESRYASWWLRTVCLMDESVISAVADDTAVGIVGIYGPMGAYLKGVRPAFCVAADSAVEKNNGMYYIK